MTAFLLPRPRTALRALASRLVAINAAHESRAAARRMDDRLLRDIGISRADL